MAKATATPTKSFMEEMTEIYGAFPEREKARIAREKENLRSLIKSEITIACTAGETQTTIEIPSEYQDFVVEFCKANRIPHQLLTERFGMDDIGLVVYGWAPDNV